MIIVCSVAWICIGILVAKLSFNTVDKDNEHLYSINNSDDRSYCTIIIILWPVWLFVIALYFIGILLKWPCKWIFK